MLLLSVTGQDRALAFGSKVSGVPAPTNLDELPSYRWLQGGCRAEPPQPDVQQQPSPP
jgi:hypothetical protein